MTAEIRLAALCDHALVGQDGKVSLMGIFRNISVSGLPAQHPRMFVVAILGLEVGAHTVKVRLLRPECRRVLPVNRQVLRVSRLRLECLPALLVNRPVFRVNPQARPVCLLPAPA